MMQPRRRSGAQVVDVITAAKRDLKAGESLDRIGGFTCYGLTENAGICSDNNYLPMSLSEDCRLKRDVSKDSIISYDDIEVPEGRLCDRLRLEQNEYFGVTAGSSSAR